MKSLLPFLLTLALVCCASPKPQQQSTLALGDCGAFAGAGGSAGGMGGAGSGGTIDPPVAPGAITGFGVNGQPRNWGTDGAAVKPALALLVNDLGARAFRVELNRGNTDWETANDNTDPAVFNWMALDPAFATKDFADLWDYVRHLNSLGVTDITLSAHGVLPAWLGGNGPSSEDEYIETLLAPLVYARTRAAEPKPVFTQFSPWNETESGPPEGIFLDTANGVPLLKKLVQRMNALPELDGIRVSAPDSQIESTSQAWRSAIGSDAVLLGRLANVSYHNYFPVGTSGSYANAVPAQSLTETNGVDFGGSFCFTADWSNGQSLATAVLSALQHGVTSALVWTEYDAAHEHSNDRWETFGLLRTELGGGSFPCGFVTPTTSELDAFTYTPKPTYWAFRHASKWIRRGAARVTASGGGPLDLVAFRNPDQKIAVFGVNSGSSGTYTVTLSTSPSPAALTPRISTSGSYDQVGAPVTLSSGSGQFIIPGASVFTLVEDGAAGTGGMGGAGGVGGSGGASGGMAGAGGAGQSGGGTGGTGQSGAGGAAGGGMGGASGSAGSSSGAVQFRAGSLAQSVTSNAVSRPAAIQGGDRIFLAHAAYDSTTTNTSATGSGWTQHATVTRSSGHLVRLWVLSRAAAGTPGAQTTEPTSYTVTNSGGEYQVLILFAVHGHDASNPVQTSTTASGASTAMSVPGITVAKAGSLGLWWKIGFFDATTTNPSGWTMVVSDQDGVNDAAWRAFGAGATGAITSQQNGGDSWVNALVVVQP